MEPEEYLTNVLSCGNFATIHYEYFELLTPLGTTRARLQKVEAEWRNEGFLVHCDRSRDGIWAFHNSSGSSVILQTKDSQNTNQQIVVETQGLRLLLHTRGIYEPSSLGRNRALVGNSLGTQTNTVPPASSLEGAARSTHFTNPRADQAKAAHASGHGLAGLSPGIRAASSVSDTSCPLSQLHEAFLSAVLGSLVYLMCRDHDFIPLNSRTLISRPASLGPSLNFDENLMVATLDISLTSLGTVVIKGYSTTASSFQSLSPSSLIISQNSPLPGTLLWLAPSGTAGRLYSTHDEELNSDCLSIPHIPGSLFDQQAHGFNTNTVSTWKSKCLEWLSVKGLNPAALEDGGWALVQVLGGGDYDGNSSLDNIASIPWPKLLCFRTPATRYRDQLRNITCADLDPLDLAEDWFTGRDSRANTITKRRRERQVAEALNKEQAELEARNLQSSTYSPAALRRGSNAGAMYPTPPDAVHNLTAATPNFEGAGSTPGNPNMFSSSDVQPALRTSSGIPDMETDLWGTSEPKELTNMDANYNGNDHDNDNIFGDIGGDIFGADVTDADFNFFDMPDDPNDSKTTPQGMLHSDQHIIDPLDMINSVDSLIASDDLMVREQSHAELSELQEEVDDSELVTLPNATRMSSKKFLVTQDSSKESSQALMRPPFDKEAIFRKVVLHSVATLKADRQPSDYSKVDFEKSLSSIDQKYGTEGRFSFPTALSGPLPTMRLSLLSQFNTLETRIKKQEPELESQMLARIMLEGRTIETKQMPEDYDPMDYLMGSDVDSQPSSGESSSPRSCFPHPVRLSSVNHKWPTTSDGKLDNTPFFDAMTSDIDHSVMTPDSISGSQVALLDADPAEWSLAMYINPREPSMRPYALTDYERICAAQILSEQAISAIFQTPDISYQDHTACLDHTNNARALVNSLFAVSKIFLPGVENCTLRSFLDIQGIPILNQTLRLPPRPIPHPRNTNALDINKLNNPFSIPSPQLEVRRSDSKLAVSPPAIAFWDVLGLGPCKGAKDVLAVCIYPSIDGVLDYAKIFLDQMRSAYESARFGTHDRIVGEDVDDGCVPYALDLTQQNQTQDVIALRDITSKLSRLFLSLSTEEANLVVYFIYCTDNAPLLVQICSAFHDLFNLYKRSMSERKKPITNELALQLVPIDFITSPTALKIPSPSRYTQISMAVYDRCTSFAESSSSPAIVLDQPPPRSIDFKLSTTPSASPLEENSCLHIAYAQSVDDRWITAAWSDNRCTQHMTASYCIGRKSEPLTMSFAEVAHEIWQTTIKFISQKKINWRLMIARVGVMDPSEAEFWIGLASTESIMQTNLTLMSVQTEPSLQLLPPLLTLSPRPGSQPAITPVSTPLNSQSIVSPDNTSTPFRDEPTPSAPTPSENPIEPDSESRLVDVTDQTWGCILAHRFNNSNSLLELNPALISGYLMKRSGTCGVDPPVVLEVNILHCEVVGNPRTFHEGLLREILGYYRGLATVARLRGVSESIGDMRPWHIAAAEKGVKALYMLM